MSSNASTVLDISGYNSFTVQCGGTFSPSLQQSGESLSFMLTRNSVSVTDGLSTSPVMTTGDTVSQSSSVQQTASSASPAILVYNCTVEFSISGSLITTASNTTQVIVKGEPWYTIGLHLSSQPTNRSLTTSSSSSTVPTTSDFTNICSDTMECSCSDLLS